jgi:hypothetical protein
MGRKIKHHAKLLERMFSRSEWEYLKRHLQFKEAIKSFNESPAETPETLELLTVVGDRLLQKWAAANPRKPKFSRVKIAKRK